MELPRTSVRFLFANPQTSNLDDGTRIIEYGLKTSIYSAVYLEPTDTNRSEWISRCIVRAQQRALQYAGNSDHYVLTIRQKNQGRLQAYLYVYENNMQRFCLQWWILIQELRFNSTLSL